MFCTSFQPLLSACLSLSLHILPDKQAYTISATMAALKHVVTHAAPSVYRLSLHSSPFCLLPLYAPIHSVLSFFLSILPHSLCPIPSYSTHTHRDTRVSLFQVLLVALFELFHSSSNGYCPSLFSVFDLNYSPALFLFRFPLPPTTQNGSFFSSVSSRCQAATCSSRTLLM